MKTLAVISDVHGNYKALEAFLEYIKAHPVDGVICLGDYVTDSPFPQRTMTLLYGMWEQYPCYVVRGNRELYLLENAAEDQNWKPSSSSGALYYTAQNLTERDMTFFEKLPDEREVCLNGCEPMYICHGIPGKPRGNVSHDDKLREAELMSIPYDVDCFLQDFAKSGLDETGMVLCKAVKKTLVTGVNFFLKSILEAERISRKLGMPMSELPESNWQEIARTLEL